MNRGKLIEVSMGIKSVLDRDSALWETVRAHPVVVRLGPYPTAIFVALGVGWVLAVPLLVVKAIVD